MSTERMARVLIVPMFLVALGVPVSATAQTRLPVPSAPLVNAQDLIRSPDGAFVLHTIEQARTQLALARLAISESSASDTRNFALQAQELWTSVDNRLHDIAHALGIPTPVEQDAKERAKLYRLQSIKAQDFDSAYERVVARGCEALLQRMDQIDPQVNLQLLFFVDDMLPRFGQLQMGIRNRYAYHSVQLPVL
jgi:predicted outer membrane protein